MPQKTIDLRPNRAFIKSNFDGYKLSLDKIPVIRQNLDIEPFRKKPSDDQYSFLHAELYALQNFLIQDPWNRGTSYFINAIGHVIKCSYGEDGRPVAPETVLKLSFPEDYPHNYNPTFIFVTEKLALISCGNNELILVDTGLRYKSSEWEPIHKQPIGEEETPYFLRDSRSDYIEGKNVISFVLQTISQKESTFVSELILGSLKQEDQKWIYQECERIVGNGSLYYCSFEPKAKALVISSNKEYKFSSQIEEEKTEDSKNGSAFNFIWSQSTEEIVLKFPNLQFENKKCKTSVEGSKFTIDLNEANIFDYELFATIDNDMTTWTFEEDILAVTLNKSTPSFWPLLFENGPLESGAAPMEPQPIVNLEAPIEECDFPIGMGENDVTICRLSLESKEVSHKIYLGNTPVLFSTVLRPGFPAAIVTRQDVDASVWLQNISHQPEGASDWNLRHEGNLHAFGYVQASKQQKKFMDCSPQLEYSVICESHRHVFLYKTKYETADGLRNRSGPQVSVGKQHLVTLEDSGEVLGLRTADDFIVLLTEKCILYLQIN